MVEKAINYYYVLSFTDEFGRGQLAEGIYTVSKPITHMYEITAMKEKIIGKVENANVSEVTTFRTLTRL